MSNSRIIASKYSEIYDGFKSQDNILAWVCPHCGVEIYGTWQYRLDKGRYDNDLSKCPCCGKNRNKANGSYNVGFYAQSDSPVRRNYNYDDFCTGREEMDDNRFFNIEHLLEKEWYNDRGASWRPDDIFAGMREVRRKFQIEDAKKSVNTLVEKYEATHRADMLPINIDSQLSTETLKRYIENIIKVESNVVALSQRLTALLEEQIEAKREAYGSTLFPTLSVNKKIEALSDKVREAQLLLNESRENAAKPVLVNAGTPPAIPLEPRYKTPSFFNKKQVLAENEEKRRRYQAAYDQYTQEMTQYERKRKQLIQIKQDEAQKACTRASENVKAAESALQTEKTNLQKLLKSRDEKATPEKARKQLLDEEIKNTEVLLEQAIKCKNQLYSVNIVFGKYRNLVAMSSIYEYLTAGRCTTLEGTNGAYNLYESELRANIIIGQLNNVLDSLETIKQQQYKIFTVMKDVEMELFRLNRTGEKAVAALGKISVGTQNMEQYMRKVAANSDIIAHNSEVSAYYSKINAQLTDSLGYMMALR